MRDRSCFQLPGRTLSDTLKLFLLLLRNFQFVRLSLKVQRVIMKTSEITFSIQCFLSPPLRLPSTWNLQ